MIFEVDCATTLQQHFLITFIIQIAANFVDLATSLILICKSVLTQPAIDYLQSPLIVTILVMRYLL